MGYSTVKSQTVIDAFRCPDELALFPVSEDLSKEAGYFWFGADTISYGRCCGSPAAYPGGISYDANPNAYASDACPQLPFNPDEVVSNLLFERYVNKETSRWEKIFRDIYYFARPLFPVWFRRHLQRLRLSGSRDSSFPRWPVDRTADQVLEKLLVLSARRHRMDQVPFVWFWPNGSPSCAVITHDVETAAGLAFCPTLMDIDESFGIKSSFQLVPESRYSVSDSTLSTIRERGFEVNVHDCNHDGRLYADRAEFLQRARRINDYARKFHSLGFRSGALYRNLDWYDAFEFSYDMSVPSVGALEAQGGGSCTLRPYFINNIVELPVTTTQDYSLFHILRDYSIDLWKMQIEEIVARNGLASFIIHPDYLMDKRAQETYRALLTFLNVLRCKGKLSIVLPSEVANWWRDRNRMTLQMSQGTWSVVGPESQRGRVAYADCADGEIKYSVSALQMDYLQSTRQNHTERCAPAST